jgi:aminobenzoyl-glutamate utilization protein B
MGMCVPNMNKQHLYDQIEDERTNLFALAEELWETPELGLHETEAVDTLTEYLKDNGFELELGVGGMPTAFVARYGEGEPCIGILGEYDALPGMSQRVAVERDPVDEDTPGHGCGHNLFGVACLGGAIAIKRAIEHGKVDGAVVYYGCPAEETLVGKVFMARAGVFDNLDAAVTWHPNDLTTPERASSLALDSVRYTFEGKSAHAAASPEAGRSALDAVQLLNTSVEYMREHVDESVRIHYVIVDGGDAPNVVPASATVWYYVRAPGRGQVERVTDWLDDIAKGAALMTQTDVVKRMVTGCYDFLPNQTVTDVLWENIQALGSIDYDESNQAFASDLQETIDEEHIESRLEDISKSQRDAACGQALYTEPISDTDNDLNSASTDVGDVSWITPTGQFRAATWTLGTPAHSWQAVAANGDFGKEGMVYAAKVIAASVHDLFTDEQTLTDARTEFQETAGSGAYECPLPADAEPPFDITTD